MRIKFNKRGFTLAEIMIVLMVIGIITAILLPVARHATPDENVLKFKKANATLGNVIRELVTSDKYYLNGDLGTRADGTPIDGSHTGDKTYFCQSFADLINAKSINCSETSSNPSGGISSVILNSASTWYTDTNGEVITDEIMKYSKSRLDIACISYQSTTSAEITASDDTIYYQTKPEITFGVVWPTTCGGRCYASPQEAPKFYDNNGFDIAYKILCVDIDGIPDNNSVSSVTIPEGTDFEEERKIFESACGNECPFGYGIRADGKILYGARAQEWIQKSIQNKD